MRRTGRESRPLETEVTHTGEKQTEKGLLDHEVGSNLAQHILLKVGTAHGTFRDGRPRKINKQKHLYRDLVFLGHN